MNLWFTEVQTKNVMLSLATENLLHIEKTDYQELAVIEHKDLGRVLFLDSVIQTSTRDEFVYHEMISHVPMNTHPHPRRVLVVGGGDGGTVREIVKHPTVEKVVLAEIDERVVWAAREYLPEISAALGDPRVEIRIGDGNVLVRENENAFDLIIVDSTDPVGPGEVLFSRDFYGAVSRALKEDGLFVAQTESPFYNEDLIRRVQQDLSAIFPVTRLYLAAIPTYPGGLWSFSLGSKKHDPLDLDERDFRHCATRYYSPAVHLAAFALPPFVRQIIGV
ncbi:MAG: polyamine aminopropyltransferase [Peptococcaceae bacterium]|jgi:spermidine synthase|nr:polyamine aminopropyltransferase [Peptococcaceae bacterium]